MLNVVKTIVKLPLFWIIILGVPSIWALFVPGFYGASDDLHIAWLYEMDKIIRIGQIPPRYVADLSFGFGYPLFNFVFPLPFYIAEVFHLFSLSLVDSIKLTFMLSLPLSAVLMYFLLREFSNKLLSLVGAILYIYTPYRSVDIYVRGAIGEIVSFIFLPLTALAVVKLAKSFSLKWVGLGGIALACLILSHNIMAYMFFPYILLFMLVRLIFYPGGRSKFLTATFSMIFLGLGISSYFWLPAILDSKLMKYDTVFNFADHFPTLKQLIIPYWGYGASVPGPNDGLSFFLGYINILVLVAGTVIILFTWKKFAGADKVAVIWSTISILSAIFLMNYRSSFIWNHLPLLPYFQFPWRFLSVTTFFVPILLISFKYIKTKNLFLFGLIAATVLTSWSYFRPQDFLGRKDEYYINRYIPVPVASADYRQTQEEYLRLPLGTMQRPDNNYPVIFSKDNFASNVIKINDLHFLADLYPGKQVLVNFNKYYFPGWQARLDGKEVALKAGSPFGQISVAIPSGQHKLEVYFSETTGKLLLDFASLMFILVSLALTL